MEPLTEQEILIIVKDYVKKHKIKPVIPSRKVSKIVKPNSFEIDNVFHESNQFKRVKSMDMVMYTDMEYNGYNIE